MLRPEPDEYEMLRRAAGHFRRSGGDWLCITGEDSLRFANGLVTCDIRALEVGSGSYGFFTDARGRVLSDAVFLSSQEALWLEVAEGLAPGIRDHMRKYVVADRVEVDVREGWSTAVVAGPETERALAAVLGFRSEPGNWSGVRLERSGAELIVRSDRRMGVPAVTVGGSQGAVAALCGELEAAGVARAGAAALAAVRIESGIPWFVPDLEPGGSGEGCFPQESGLEGWAVSYDKGCYLGQEVVARIHFRGKVNRSLKGVLFEPDSEPAGGATLQLEGEAVGVLTSVAYSPRMGRPAGLGLVHHKAVAGAELATPSGPGRLVELPFAGLP